MLVDCKYRSSVQSVKSHCRSLLEMRDDLERRCGEIVRVRKKFVLLKFVYQEVSLTFFGNR